ncbi:palmitoyltransferase ZDHHC2 isoform X4 [Brienomyrus brachyistius]|uniref:palmitoyltransferase ZDHHC2 isoform X4 n=1 Tax=Brienomyrus brachyistius TaxID=42636 RepID=UPI0020B40920|nr:palmitoyltransferase ZDHHC2 isoform X4 [Brienomyrus brachyistius]
MAPSGSRSVKRSCQRVLYWIPVLFISIIVAWSYYAYVIQLCIESMENTGEKVVCLLTYHVLFIMFVWAYWQTIFTKPMTPVKEFQLTLADKEMLEREDRSESQQEILRRISKDLPIYTRTMSGAVRYCDRCQIVKPDRCHHCSVCDKCILKMDHHCPWVNNCVGFSNYKFFILFLAYSLLYCLFIAVTDLRFFIKFWTSGLPDTQAKFHIMFLFFAASMFSVSLSSLFGYHCWLVCRNRSTLEAFRAPAFHDGADKNGFSLGFNENFRQVFGNDKKLWLLPVFSSLGDGCSYPTSLVKRDAEQPPIPAGHNSPTQSTGDAPQFPAKPLRESQSRLLPTGHSWTRNEQVEDQDTRGPRGSYQGIPRAAERYNLSSVSWVCPGTSSQLGMPETPPQGAVQEPAETGCSDHFNWLVSMRRSNSSTLRSFRMLEHSAEPRHPAAETHFFHLYQRSHSFGHYPELMTIGTSNPAMTIENET